MTTSSLFVPPLPDLLASAHVVSLPMRVTFRGVTERETVVFRGPAGWGEFGPFPEYGDTEAAASQTSARGVHAPTTPHSCARGSSTEVFAIAISRGHTQEQSHPQWLSTHVAPPGGCARRPA